MSSGDDASQKRTLEDPNNVVTSPNVHELKEPEVPLSSEIKHSFDSPTNHEVIVMSDDEENVKTAHAETQEKADGENVEVMPENLHDVGSETKDKVMVISDDEEEKDDDEEEIEDFMTRLQAAATLCMMPDNENKIGPETEDNVIVISDDEDENYFDDDDFMTADILCMMSEIHHNVDPRIEDNTVVISDDEDNEESISENELDDDDDF